MAAMSDKAASPGAVTIDIQANCSSIHASATQQAAPDAASLQQQQQQQQQQEGQSRKRLLAGAACGRQGLTLDEALTKYIGDFGRGQLFIWALASLFWVPNAVVILLLVFTLGSPVADRAWECVNPTDAICQQAFASPTPATAFCTLGADQWRWTNPGHSLIATFNLTCTQAWKTQLANSFFFVGYLIGSGLFGYLADRYGRKPMLFGSTAWAALFTAACIGATNYWVLMVLRLLAGIGVAGQALTCYILATEMIGPSRRGVAGIITQVLFIVGEFALVLFALGMKPWKGHFTAAAVLSAAFLLLWPLLPESARWLLVQGRQEEAKQVLRKLAAWNRSQMPTEPLADMSSSSNTNEEGGAAAPVGLLVALRDWHVARRFFILAYTWMVVCMAYYGISFALSGLGGSLLVSFSIAAIAELPSYIIAGWMIEKWGRHNIMAGGMLLGGAACLGCGLIPSGPGQAGLAAVGKFGIAGSFAIASIYTSELFPTLIRSAVLGAENQAARVGGIVAPFIALAGVTTGNSMVSFGTFGCAALLAGILVFTLPETLGAPLPETMSDMGVIASIFTHKTLQKKGFKAATLSMFKTKVKLPKTAAALHATEEEEELEAAEEERAATLGRRPGM